MEKWSSELRRDTHRLWIPPWSESRQGLFTSEQKADPTPRLFVPLSHCWRFAVDGSLLKCQRVFTLHVFTCVYHIYLLGWDTLITTIFLTKPKGILSHIFVYCIVFVSYYCVIFMVSQYLAWDHEEMNHVWNGAQPDSREMQNITFQRTDDNLASDVSFLSAMAKKQHLSLLGKSWMIWTIWINYNLCTYIILYFIWSSNKHDMLLTCEGTLGPLAQHGLPNAASHVHAHFRGSQRLRCLKLGLFYPGKNR